MKRRTKPHKKLKRRRAVTSEPYPIGQYVKISKKRYKKILKKNKGKTFHIGEGHDWVTIRVMNKKIRKALIKTEIKL